MPVLNPFSNWKLRNFAAFFLIAVVVTGLLYLPRYLSFADQAAPSDVIVILVGPNDEERFKEAVQLLSEGYARCIMIPLYRLVLMPKDLQTLRPNWPDTIQIDKNAYPSYYENTHLELIVAKEMMNQSSFRSAIFVSSAQHMKRISVICTKVFGADARRFSFVPTRCEKKPEYFGRKAIALWMNALLEVIKTAWFRIYSSL